MSSNNPASKIAARLVIGTLKEYGIVIPCDFEQAIRNRPDWLRSTQLFKYIINTEQLDVDILNVHVKVTMQYR